MRRGSYAVVLDTIVERMTPEEIGDRRWAPGNSPMSAVRQFLTQSDRFEIDRRLEDTLLITVALVFTDPRFSHCKRPDSEGRASSILAQAPPAAVF